MSPTTTTTLPIFPLEPPQILLPASRLTLPIKKEHGHALITLIQESDPQPGPIVAAFPVLNSADEKSTPVLNEWGTAARVVRLIRPSALTPSQPYLVLLHGLTRIRLAKPLKLNHSFSARNSDGDNDNDNDNDTLLLHPVQYPSMDAVPSTEVVDAFKGAAIRLLDRLAQETGVPARRDAWTRFAAMVDDVSEKRAGWLADVLVGAVSGEYSDRLDYLSAHDSTDRLKRATQLFIKQASISEVSKKIATAVDESLSKQQKEFFLRQQLAAIQRELNDLSRSSSSGSRSFGADASQSNSSSELDEDESAGGNGEEMADIKRKIEAMEVGSEERKMGVREWRRLKRIPAASVEYGVVRTYLEWLTSLPWPSSSTATNQSTNNNNESDPFRSPYFLKRARTQLDADHYGLEKIKRRLIEYLAVVRLRRIVEENELAVDAREAKEVKNEIGAAGQNLDHGQEGAPSLNQSQDEKRRSRGKGGVKGPILLFAGPPGTGKTSLGQSIARALNLPFQRISLGGVRDEAEIRGHRRTYVASGPGAVVQALRRMSAEREEKGGRGSGAQGVILLDEIDKIGQGGFHGDPAAALLEVLDPEQNCAFNDHYINVPIDLSKILFICTANTLDTISAPLLDRCEVVHLAGYTPDEKQHIAKQFLLPKQLSANGLSPKEFRLTDTALMKIVSGYTREAGVRSLERSVGAVVRAKAVEWAEYVDDQSSASSGSSSAPSSGNANEKTHDRKKAYNPLVEERDLEKILGVPRWDGDEREREERRGVVYGLVVTGMGEGSIMPVETIALPGCGKLKLTGSLGDVIKESGELALSWVKMHAFGMRVTSLPSQDPLKVPDPIDIHLHLPAGAQKKDGPSAGVAMVCAFVSLLTGASVSPNIAMTGEITLRGRVTPVGGIKEKVLGAHRARMTKVILPYANKKDVEQDVAKEIRAEMEFAFVRTVEEALEEAFGKGTLSWRTRKESLFVESRL